jgi:hypothetical protein
MDDPESSLRIPESCQILPDILQGTLIRESGSGVEVVFRLTHTDNSLLLPVTAHAGVFLSETDG